jgi:two-component system NtrC family sensor kinase
MDSGKNILVVDDDELVRRALERALRSTGYRIYTASGGLQALELLEKHAFIAVISDHLMPGMTGLELMREVKRRFPPCVKIIITGFMPERVAEALSAGEIDRFMTKPWENAELRSTLSAAIAEQVALDPAVVNHPAA